jgi:hypothetical protein
VQVICKDGTTIQCQDFEAIDSGVLFYQDRPGRREATTAEDEEAEEEMHERASGFVPITELRFVLSDEMVQQQAAQRSAVPEQGPASQVPPSAPQQRSGRMAQQQQMQQFPDSSSGRTQDFGGQ